MPPDGDTIGKVLRGGAVECHNMTKNKESAWKMEPFYLMPGQERCEQFKDANGVPKVRYSYCSLNGALFRCVSRSVEEAERLCEDWLVGQDRCYIN